MQKSLILYLIVNLPIASNTTFLGLNFLRVLMHRQNNMNQKNLLPLHRQFLFYRIGYGFKPLCLVLYHPQSSYLWHDLTILVKSFFMIWQYLFFGVILGSRSEGQRNFALNCRTTLFIVTNFVVKYRSTVAHWYAICFVSGGPGFKSRQGR